MTYTRILLVVICVSTIGHALGLSDSQCKLFVTKNTSKVKKIKSSCTIWGSCKATKKCTSSACTTFYKGGVMSQMTFKALQSKSAKYSKACKPKFKNSIAALVKLSSSTILQSCIFGK